MRQAALKGVPFETIRQASDSRQGLSLAAQRAAYAAARGGKEQNRQHMKDAIPTKHNTSSGTPSTGSPVGNRMGSSEQYDDTGIWQNGAMEGEIYAGVELDKSIPIEDIRGKSTGDVEMPRPPKPGSLDDVEARRWYLDAESKIPELLDNTKPLEQQAMQAFELRNRFRAETRQAMRNRAAAQELDMSNPSMTWEQILRKYADKKYSGTALYEEIINASTRSRKSVNESLGILDK